MKKNYILPVIIIITTFLLAGCATAPVPNVTDEPKQGENNQEFVIKAPVAGKVDANAYIVEGLPQDLPVVPFNGASYIDGSYSKSQTNTDNQVWAISIIGGKGMEATIAQTFLAAGYSQNLTTEQTGGKAQGFTSSEYKVVIATAEASAGTPYSYVYTITALAKS